MRSREVLMCSERYADDIPLRLPNTQLPPIRSLFSKQSNGIPASFSFLAAAMPDEPAPMMHAVGSSRGLMGAAKQDVTGVSTLAARWGWWRAARAPAVAPLALCASLRAM